MKSPPQLGERRAVIHDQNTERLPTLRVCSPLHHQSRGSSCVKRRETEITKGAELWAATLSVAVSARHLVSAMALSVVFHRNTKTRSG